MQTLHLQHSAAHRNTQASVWSYSFLVDDASIDKAAWKGTRCVVEHLRCFLHTGLQLFSSAAGVDKLVLVG